MSLINITTIACKLKSLGFRTEQDQWLEFNRWARLTALRQAPDKTFYLSNWWRGPLLYTLISHYRPRHILEFGTGRGYSALSMIKASIDHGFDCTLWTIDLVSPYTPQNWAIDEGHGPTIKLLSLQEVWALYLPEEIGQRVQFLTGNSISVMQTGRREQLPLIDFFFIDGGHDYWMVKHDFIRALQVANTDAVFLFDDYGNRAHYGVNRLFDEEIVPRCPGHSVEIIDTLADEQRPESAESIEHRMALLDGHALGDLAYRFYSSMAIRYHLTVCFMIARLRRVRAMLRR
jgi:hypothetical protein